MRESRYNDQFLDGEADVTERVVLVRRADFETFTNVPHAVTHHSPDGFEWGYGGSGPADLALNICEIYAADMGLFGEYPGTERSVSLWDGNKCSGVAWAVYQTFKRRFLGPLGRENNSRHVIEGEEIRAFFREQLAGEDLRARVEDGAKFNREPLDYDNTWASS